LSHPRHTEPCSMIHWFAIGIFVVAGAGALASFGVFTTKRGPNDFSIIPTAVAALLLIVQIIITIAAPLTGNPPVGDLLEIWLYLITAAALPILTGVWALVDKTRWANLVLTVMHLAVAVMVWRMLVLWFGKPSGF